MVYQAIKKYSGRALAGLAAACLLGAGAVNSGCATIATIEDKLGRKAPPIESLDSLFSKKELTPVSSCVAYDGAITDEGKVSFYKFRYEPRKQKSNL